MSSPPQEPRPETRPAGSDADEVPARPLRLRRYLKRLPAPPPVQRD